MRNTMWFLRLAGDPAKSEHQVIKSEINALNDWIAPDTRALRDER